MADRQINLRINIAIQQSQDALKILQTRLDLLNKRLQAGGLSDAAIKKINKEIQLTTQSVNTLTNSMNRLTTSTQKSGNMWMNISRYFSAFLVVSQVARAIRSVAENYVEFSNIMATNRALMQGSKQDLEDLSASALELSKTSKFTAIEIAKLQTNLIKLGVQGVPTLDLLTQSIMNLAAASDEDLAKSGDVLYSIINQFGLTAADATDVVNIMTDTFVKSASDLDSYANSMKYVGSSAHQLGLNLRETSALIATISNLNIKGSSAGTAMNNLLMEMAKNSANLNKAFGIQINGFEDVISVLEKMQGMDTASIMGIMNIRSTKAALPFKDADLLEQLKVLSGQLDATGKKATEVGFTIANALGGDILNSAANMAKTAMDSVSGDLKKLQANATALGLETMKSIDGPIRSIVQGFNKAISSARDFFSFLQTNWSTIQPILKGIVFYLEAIAILWATNKMTMYFKTMASGFLLFQERVTTNYRSMIALRNANLAAGASLNVLQKGLTLVGATMKSVAASNPFGLMLVAALALEKIFKNLPGNVEKARIQAEKIAVSDAMNAIIPKAARSATEMPGISSKGEELVKQIPLVPIRSMDKGFKKAIDEEKMAIQGVISAIEQQQAALKELSEVKLVKEKEFMKAAQEATEIQLKVNKDELQWTTILAGSTQTAAERVEELSSKMVKMYDEQGLAAINGVQIVNRNIKEIFAAEGGLAEAWWTGDYTKIRKKEAPFEFPVGSKEMLVDGKKNVEYLRDLYERLTLAQEDYEKSTKVNSETMGLTLEELNKQSDLKYLEHMSRMAEIRLNGKKDELDYVEDVRDTKNAELRMRKQLTLDSILNEDEKNVELQKIYEAQVQVESTYANNRNKMYEIILGDQEKYLKQKEKNLKISGENIKQQLENEKQLIDALSLEGYIGQFEIQIQEIYFAQRELVDNATQTYLELEIEQKKNSLSMMKEAKERQVEQDKIAYDEAALRLGYNEERILKDKTYKDKLIVNEKLYNTEFQGINDQAQEEITRGKINMNTQILNAQELLHQKQLANERDFIKSFAQTQMEYEQMLSDLAVQVAPTAKNKISQSKTNEKADIKSVNDQYAGEELKYGVSGAFDLGLWDKKQKAITDITRKYSIERLEILAQESQKYIQMFSDMVNEVSQLIATQKEIEQQTIDNSYEQQIKSAENLQDRLLTEYDLKNKEESQMTGAQVRKLNKINKQAEEAKLKAEKKKEEDSLALKKKYADKEFALKVMQILGNTAMAISSIWAEWAWMPPVAIAMSAVAGVIGGVQLVQAKKQKDAVQNLEIGGLVKGPSHKQGGVPVELEGDEVVINKKSASIPWVRDMALQLNRVNNSKSSYGRVMANGGVVTSAPQQQQIDIRELVTEVTQGVVNTIQVVNNTLDTTGKSDNVKKVINRTTW